MMITSLPVDARVFRQAGHLAFVAGHPDGLAEPLEDLLARLAGDSPAPERFVKGIPTVLGEFAIAIVAPESTSVWLIGDPLGIRPIYYAKTSGGWAWSFSLKELLPYLEEPSIDMVGVDEIFRYRWLAEEHTLFSGVKQVLPSHCVHLVPGREARSLRYAGAFFEPSADKSDFALAVEDTDKALDRYFEKLRARHSRVGILFSGGVDSGLLLAKALGFGFDKVVAATGVFPGHDNPEIGRAREVAGHLGTTVRAVEVDDTFVARSLDDFILAMERPPTHLNGLVRLKIFEEIHEEVDVVLVGEGADISFSDYRSSDVMRFRAKQRWLRHFPAWLRRSLAAATPLLPENTAKRLRYALTKSLADYLRDYKSSDGILDGNGRMRASDLAPALAKPCSPATRPFFSGPPPEDTDALITYCQENGIYTQNRNGWQCYTLLADRFGLAVEAPFLSGEIWPVTRTLHNSLKWNDEEGGHKPILKKLVARYVPPHLVHASKLGFETPEVDWLRGPLGYWRDMLSDSCTARRGIFDVSAVGSLDVERDFVLIWTALALETFFRLFQIPGERKA